MKYWTETIDSHIRLAETDVYKTYEGLKNGLNKDGYVDDILQPSDVIFMGSCDLMTSMPTPQLRWAKLLHNSKHSTSPFVAIGSSAAGLPTTIRRLHSYIQNYGPAKLLYLSVARIDGLECVNQSGLCYNVNSRIGTPKYLNRRNLLAPREFNAWVAQVDAFKMVNNLHYVQYILEERFSFLELMCKHYNIELKWTINLTDAAIVTIYKNIGAFNAITPFMKESFVGVPLLEDHLPDRSMGEKTHHNVFNMFEHPEKWDYDVFTEKITLNYQWMIEQYGNQNLIKNEN